MKKVAIIGKILTVGLMAAAMSGCASYMVVSGRNDELDKKALQLRAGPDGAFAAVDLLGLKGYWQAWKAAPAAMTGATLLDVGTAAAAAYAVTAISDSGNSDKPSTPSISNSGNGTVIVNTGSGGTSYTTTQTGAAE